MLVFRAARTAWVVVYPVFDGRSDLRRRYHHQCLTWTDVFVLVLAAVLGAVGTAAAAWGLKGLMILVWALRATVRGLRMLMAM